jgi:hypothetical protein
MILFISDLVYVHSTCVFFSNCMDCVYTFSLDGLNILTILFYCQGGGQSFDNLARDLKRFLRHNKRK